MGARARGEGGMTTPQNACLDQLPGFSNQIIKNSRAEAKHYLFALTTRLQYCCTHSSSVQKGSVECSSHST